jgi:hypothetical protein
MHGGNENPQPGYKKHMMAMQVPSYFGHIREMRQAQTMIKEQTKEK